MIAGELPPLYRVLGPNGESPFARKTRGAKLYRFPLPTNGEPGPWIQLGTWYLTSMPLAWPCYGMTIWEAEAATNGPAPVREEVRMPCVPFLPEPAGSLVADEWVVSSFRLIRQRPDLIPAGWPKAEEMIAYINARQRRRWFRPRRGPLPEYQMFPTRADAVAATKGAAVVSRADLWHRLTLALDTPEHAPVYQLATSIQMPAGSLVLQADRKFWTKHQPAFWDAAQDTALMVALAVTEGVPIDEWTAQVIRAAWTVWRLGYGFLGLADGVPIVYRAP